MGHEFFDIGGAGRRARQFGKHILNMNEVLLRNRINENVSSLHMFPFIF